MYYQNVQSRNGVPETINIIMNVAITIASIAFVVAITQKLMGATNLKLQDVMNDKMFMMAACAGGALVLARIVMGIRGCSCSAKLKDKFVQSINQCDARIGVVKTLSDPVLAVSVRIHHNQIGVEMAEGNIKTWAEMLTKHTMDKQLPIDNNQEDNQKLRQTIIQDDEKFANVSDYITYKWEGAIQKLIKENIKEDIQNKLKQTGKEIDELFKKMTTEMGNVSPKLIKMNEVSSKLIQTVKNLKGIMSTEDNGKIQQQIQLLAKVQRKVQADNNFYLKGVDGKLFFDYKIKAMNTAIEDANKILRLVMGNTYNQLASKASKKADDLQGQINELEQQWKYTRTVYDNMRVHDIAVAAYIRLYEGYSIDKELRQCDGKYYEFEVFSCWQYTEGLRDKVGSELNMAKMLMAHKAADWIQGERADQIIDKLQKDLDTIDQFASDLKTAYNNMTANAKSTDDLEQKRKQCVANLQDTDNVLQGVNILQDAYDHVANENRIIRKWHQMVLSRSTTGRQLLVKQKLYGGEHKLKRLQLWQNTIQKKLQVAQEAHNEQDKQDWRPDKKHYASLNKLDKVLGHNNKTLDNKTLAAEVKISMNNSM